MLNSFKALFKKALATSAVFASLAASVSVKEGHATPLVPVRDTNNIHFLENIVTKVYDLEYPPCDISANVVCNESGKYGFQVAPKFLIIQDDTNPLPQVDIYAENVDEQWFDLSGGPTQPYFNFVSPVKASEVDAQKLIGGTANFENLSIGGVNVKNRIDANEDAVELNKAAIEGNDDDIAANSVAILSNSSSIVELKAADDGHQRQINDNKSAIRKNKKAIDTNRANINNLGDGIAASTALGAALSALPVTPDDAPFSCGVGSGAYSSRFAVGLGCVAKLNQRLSLNAGGSHVFGGSSNYGGGSLDSVAWRGGFVFKLGKLDSPAATNEQLQSKVESLEDTNARILEENATIKEENAVIKAKYSTIEEQNKALMARLERLEAIALGQQPATTTASLK